jgi:2-keto-4-pentenoate hydratase/2-oxohepta-3-ene-1,7-dioic acid hydratase in catechol pathway
MQLVRLGPTGAERPSVRDDEGQHWDLSSVTDDVDGDFLASDGVQHARDALAAGALPRLDGADLRVGAPILPGAVICIGQNYAAHAAESGSPPPETPIIFLKTPNTVVGPDDDVAIPPGAEKTDWEVELGVVIGRPASYLDSPDDARSHIAGYVICNDVSERAFQLEKSGGQWSKGKCCPTFNPLGPWLVPADEVGDPQNLRLCSWVNGEPRQDSTTADMIFTVDYLVWHLSQFLTLDAGYVISTGTPEGVALSGRFPYLQAGDVMELEVEKLGRQRQRLVPAS